MLSQSAKRKFLVGWLGVVAAGLLLHFAGFELGTFLLGLTIWAPIIGYVLLHFLIGM